MNLCTALHNEVICKDCYFVDLSLNYRLLYQKTSTFRNFFFHNKHKNCKMILATGFRTSNWWFWTLQTISINVYIYNTWNYFTARPLKGRLYDHTVAWFNPLNPELNPICYLLALLGARHYLHVSRIRVKLLTFRRLMSYIYGAPILDVSRSHTTTQHSR